MMPKPPIYRTGWGLKIIQAGRRLQGLIASHFPSFLDEGKAKRDFLLVFLANTHQGQSYVTTATRHLWSIGIDLANRPCEKASPKEKGHT